MDFYQDAAGILMAEPEKHQAFKKLIFLTDPNIVLGTEFDMFFKVRYSTNELLAQFLLQAMRPLKFIENTETKVILPVEGSS